MYVQKRYVYEWATSQVQVPLSGKIRFDEPDPESSVTRTGKITLIRAHTDTREIVGTKTSLIDLMC